MPAKKTRLYFPILRRVEVHGYAMYPGNGEGINKDFQPGCNAIVGINGVGKTTLLNVLLRLILGVYDPKKADATEPGAKLHELVRPRKFDYFSSRIGGDSREATAAAEISFGKDLIKVVRSLGPKLEVVDLFRNGKRLRVQGEGSSLEDRYLELVRELSGIEDHYDFDFVVRNLLFFLEEKVPLIWNPKGQFEILRILFLDRELAAKTSELHDKIMQLDSRYRNRYWAVRARREHHDRTKADLAGAPENELTLSAAKAASEAKGKRAEELLTEVKQLESKITSLRSEQFQAEQTLGEKSRGLERLERDFLVRVFPDIDARAELLYGTLLATGNCAMCGTESKAAKTRIKGLLAATKCPCCESALKKSERVTHKGHLEAKRLVEAESAQKAAATALEKVSQLIDAYTSDLASTRQSYLTAERERSDLDFKIASLEAKRGIGQQQVDETERLIQVEELEVAALLDRRNKSQRAYETLLIDAREQIEEVADQVVDKFAEFANSFLSEHVELSYKTHERAIGQSGVRLAFPSFILKMSSGAAPTLSERDEDEEVSESQKEFVDLAFRMAILEACRDRAGPGMLVIETPEASLDSVFIERAGKMLRQFGNDPEVEQDNVIIASTNLNKENMLSQLLGTKGTVRSPVKQGEIRSRVLNLISIAAKTAAYKANKKAYDLALEQALGFRF